MKNTQQSYINLTIVSLAFLWLFQSMLMASYLESTKLRVDDTKKGIYYNKTADAALNEKAGLGFGTYEPIEKVDINYLTHFQGNVGWDIVAANNTVNWNEGNVQKITYTSGAITFTAPAIPHNYACILTLILEFNEAGTAAPAISDAQWVPAANFYWKVGVRPIFTKVQPSLAFIHFYYDGTNYYGWPSPDYHGTAATP